MIQKPPDTPLLALLVHLAKAVTVPQFPGHCRARTVVCEMNLQMTATFEIRGGKVKKAADPLNMNTDIF